MKNLLILLLISLAYSNCFAIDHYKKGDTLWVWAKGGLEIRESDDPNSKVMGKIENGERVLMMNDLPMDNSFSITEIKKNGDSIGFDLTGAWVLVTHKTYTGYVFNAYLSHLPTMIGKRYDDTNEEDFYVRELKKHYTIAGQEDKKNLEKETHEWRYFFDAGHVIEYQSEKKEWIRGIYLSGNLSLMEGYLIYKNTIQESGDMLLEIGEDYLIFETISGQLSIKKFDSLLIIHEFHHG